MNKPSVQDSFGFAIKGIQESLRTERNFRIDIFVGLGVFFICELLRIRGTERALLVALVFFVISFEILNTALETTVDTWMFEFHEYAKRAKDISAAAVLTSAIGALVVGLLVIGPAFQQFLAKPFLLLSDQAYWLVLWAAVALLFLLWCLTHPLEPKYVPHITDEEATLKESD